PMIISNPRSSLRAAAGFPRRGHSYTEHGYVTRSLHYFPLAFWRQLLLLRGVISVSPMHHLPAIESIGQFVLLRLPSCLGVLPWQLLTTHHSLLLALYLPSTQTHLFALDIYSPPV